MEIRYVSDLHLEVSGRGLHRKDTPFQLPVSDVDRHRVLVLAGDIDVGMRSCDFALKVAEHFHAAVLVLGNHEYYGQSLARLPGKLLDRVKAAGVGNVHVLERRAVTLGSLRIIGATLWTDFRRGSPTAMDAAKTQMRDFRRIRTGPPDAPYAYRVHPRDLMSIHVRTKAYIEEEVARAHYLGQTPVVVTHHAPYYPYSDWGPSISFSYGSDLTALIERARPALWIHGHTHEVIDTRIGGCRVVSNARGYGGLEENEAFDAHRLLRVE
ncbi:metallophosphoesterase [Spiribacter halobius]|uniref:metallophosphoesterase n=1 Tax=Sediminicurvatus halobius TaxID=2182432 RepID=UPI001E55840F|nr:metallophosphoesterase [Spiribacter halobius]UEX77257.1 metallophosphoesterase [Spiribacter halobius]